MSVDMTLTKWATCTAKISF